MSFSDSKSYGLGKNGDPKSRELPSSENVFKQKSQDRRFGISVSNRFFRKEIKRVRKWQRKFLMKNCNKDGMKCNKPIAAIIIIEKSKGKTMVSLKCENFEG